MEERQRKFSNASNDKGTSSYTIQSWKMRVIELFIVWFTYVLVNYCDEETKQIDRYRSFENCSSSSSIGNGDSNGDGGGISSSSSSIIEEGIPWLI